MIASAMLLFTIVLCISLFLQQQLAALEQNVNNCHHLPSWISENPAFKNPNLIDSLSTGSGLIVSNETKNIGWVVELNSEPGLGIEIVLEQLTLGTNENDYLIIAGWPIRTTEFKQIKLYTGKLTTSQTFRILNSKQFFILLNAGESKIPPRMVVSYKRYGSPFGTIPPPTEAPVQADTAFDIYLKGRKPSEYFDGEFRREIKEAIRETAKEFCSQNDIKFNDSIPTDKMVIFHKISLCPFEWPDTHICVFLEHSVFVSEEQEEEEEEEKHVEQAIGHKYELTADHLRTMWFTSDLDALKKIGVVVFQLPETTDIFVWWVVVIGITVLSSLILVVFFCRVEKHSKETRKSSADLGGYKMVVPHKKLKLRLARQQQIPSFMLKSSGLKENAEFDEVTLKSFNRDNFINKKAEDNEGSPQSPIKNYIGSLLFSTNSGFLNDEGETTLN